MNNDVRQRIIEVTARHFKAPKALRTFCEKVWKKRKRPGPGSKPLVFPIFSVFMALN